MVDKINLDAITEAMIATAAQDPNIHSALSKLQNAAGIKHGDVAGVVFSDCGEDSIFNEDNWPKLTPEQRTEAINHWIDTERLYVDDEEEA